MILRSLVFLFVFPAFVFCNAIPFNWLVNDSKLNSYSDNHDHRATYDDSSLLQQTMQTPATAAYYPQRPKVAEAEASPIGWKKAVLDVHNNARLEHCASDLSWDHTIAAHAQDRADGLCSSGKLQVHHSGLVSGENNYMSWGRGLSDMSTHGTTGVAAWYAEGSQYNYSHSTFNSAAWHFTQVIAVYHDVKAEPFSKVVMMWGGSEKIGCGIAACNSSNGPTMVLSCNYYPAVQFTESLHYNVQDPASCGRRRRTTSYPDIHDGPAACECICHMDDTKGFRLRVLMDKLPELIL